MSVKIIYQMASESTRDVIQFLRDFEKRTNQKLEEVDPDSAHGAQICELYDVVQYPTVLATTADGQLRNMWRGLPLPLIDEVSYYAE